MNSLRTLLANNLRWLLVGAVTAVLVWLTFFDSHSLLKRYRWHTELVQMREENADLQRRIDHLERELADGISDEEIERIAREQYGMRKPGETVYRVEEKE